MKGIINLFKEIPDMPKQICYSIFMGYTRGIRRQELSKKLEQDFYNRGASCSSDNTINCNDRLFNFLIEKAQDNPALQKELFERIKENPDMQKIARIALKK
ncbi:hypothetical protein CLOSTMETH_02041 [[Clostridium] methylpentosum DSM 5476]|uniref:Uncharacterized protein n=1 Tax=[Clostridium] methylpentosum DSM 5476 TaxID=537013 RepID=C0EDW2_9FIRM|nr:hypothetical protein CLOSTMETH_02041 [[Clostridium] methylpentosum DSM 5476]